MSDMPAAPGDFWTVVDKRSAAAAAQQARSGPLRNASTSGGAGFTVGAGSKFTVLHPSGRQMLLAGVYDTNHAYDTSDGAYQPMLLLRRADGTACLTMFDPAPSPSGGTKQFIAIWDRASNILISDDTATGQGLARPYLDSQPRLTRYTDWPTFGLAATGAWETVYAYSHIKHHPRLEVCVYASMDTSGTTGLLRVMVDGVQLGSDAALAFAQGPNYFGPANVAGDHMQTLDVQIQIQRTTASGGVKLAPAFCRGRQSP